MAYIEGYPICITPSQIMTVGIRNPESFETGLRTIVRVDGRIWQLIDDPVAEGGIYGWFEKEPSGTVWSRDFDKAYDAFEREYFESRMVESGEIVMSLADGAL